MTLDLRGRAVGEPTARLLTADRLHVHNSAASPEAVVPRPFDGVKATGQGLVLTLPPHSFITVQAPLARTR